MKNKFLVYCADIGSELKESDSHFAWVNKSKKNDEFKNKGKTLISLAEDIFDNIEANPLIKIAIGFECPLYFDMHPDDSTKVTQGRKFGISKGEEIGEGDRPWSGGPGANVLVTGLAQTTWLFYDLFEKLKGKVINPPEIFIMDSWEVFNIEESGIFIWEAFISKDDHSNNEDKKERHFGDAKKGLNAFFDEYDKHKDDKNESNEQEYFSIIGSVLKSIGWAIKKEHLKRKCIVIPPRK